MAHPGVGDHGHSTADRQKATVRVRIGFDALDQRILPDMGVRVSFLDEEVVSSEGRSRVVVAAAAVFRRDNETFVFVIHGDTIERRAVTVGAEANGEVEIRAGLTGSERVVLHPTPELGDGLEVKWNQG